MNTRAKMATLPGPSPSPAVGSATMEAVAMIRGARGYRGEVWVERYREGYPCFSEGERLFLQRGGDLEAVTVQSSFQHKGRCVLKLEGFDGIQSAEGLKGLELSLPLSEMSPAPPGSFDVGSLNGCEVRDRSRGLVGKATGATEGPAYWYIQASGPSGEFEFPAVSGLGVSVDTDGREIVVDLPPNWPGLDIPSAGVPDGGSAP